MRFYRIIGIFLALGPTPRAFAQLNPPAALELIPSSGMIGRCNFITGEFHFDCFPLYLAYLIQVLFMWAMGTCLAQILQAGYEWAFAGLGGDTQGARNRLKHAVYGLIASILAFLIVDTIVINVLTGP